jgi:hypothetical protein
MKKKELKRRLAITQEWLDKFQGNAADATIQTMIVTKERDELRAELDNAKYVRPWKCPWCNVDAFQTSSDLRLHEQECGSNRNRWQPERRPVGWTDVVNELDLGDIKGVVSTDTMVFAIKNLKHAARPICVVCGASSYDITTMRKHMIVEHAFDWENWPKR